MIQLEYLKYLSIKKRKGNVSRRKNVSTANIFDNLKEKICFLFAKKSLIELLIIESL